MGMGLENAAAIVTGGGSGIGRAAALKLAAEGAKVVVADLDQTRAETVVGEITSAGGQAVAAVGDLSEPAVVDRVVATCVEQFGGVDVLVANAGIMDSMTALHEVSDEEWNRLMRINLTAPFLIMRAVLPKMLEKGKGSIVATSSEAGLRGSAAGTSYTVSKHGLIGLVRSASVMYRNHGIRVNAVAPGGTATNIQVNIDPAKMHGAQSVGAYQGNIGRIAEAAELGNAIAFLASDLASDITGVVLPVDGGWSAI